MNDLNLFYQVGTSFVLCIMMIVTITHVVLGGK